MAYRCSDCGVLNERAYGPCEDCAERAPVNTLGARVERLASRGRPKAGKTYALFRAGPCVANGNTWDESQVLWHVTRDGERVLGPFDSEGEARDAFMVYCHRMHSFSSDWGLKHEGYKIEEAK
jgi:hypothetical protein